MEANTLQRMLQYGTVLQFRIVVSLSFTVSVCVTETLFIHVYAKLKFCLPTEQPNT